MEWMETRISNIWGSLTSLEGVPLVALGHRNSSTVLLHDMGSRDSFFSDLCSITVVSGDSDLDSPDVILGWRGRPGKKPASDRSNEVNCMVFCTTKQRQVCKTLGLHCCLHLSFSQKLHKSLEALVGTGHWTKSCQKDHFLKNFMKQQQLLKAACMSFSMRKLSWRNMLFHWFYLPKF